MLQPLSQQIAPVLWRSHVPDHPDYPDDIYEDEGVELVSDEEEDEEDAAMVDDDEDGSSDDEDDDDDDE